MIRAYLDALARVRASYPPEKRRADLTTELPTFLVYRPLSFWITPLFLGLGLSANAVTLLGLLIALALPVAAHLGVPWGFAWVAGLSFAFHVLDCVDGNVARVRGSSSPVGKMLDGITSLLFWALYLLAAGILAQQSGAGSLLARHGRELGLLLAFLLVTQRELEDTYDGYFSERVRWEPPVAAGNEGSPFSVSSLGRTLEHLYTMGGLFAAGWWGRLDLFLGVIAAWQLLLFLLWLPRFALAIRRKA